MRSYLNFWAVTITILTAAVISYVLCILGDVLFGWTMYEAWAPLLPGFTWPLTAGGVLIGLLWLVAYSVYGAAIVVLPYNYLMRQQEAT